VPNPTVAGQRAVFDVGKKHRLIQRAFGLSIFSLSALAR